jgi:hypothetical protein
MRPREAQFADLRLAAKAADRGKAAKLQWPAFEKRLRELGYGPRAIAHAFSTLSGPGSVAEALEVLRAPMPRSHPVALSFKVTETRGGPSVANRVTITAVERDDSEIQVNYVVDPPPDLGSHQARGEAKDDLGNGYRDLGGYFGITGSIDSTDRANTRAQGRLRMPLPPPAATTLRIRIRWEAAGVIRMPWEASLSSVWDGPAHEVRVSLPD